MLPRSCLIFQSTVRMQENHDIFREKLSATASLQRPRRCQGALMAFYRVPTVFMVEIFCDYTACPRRLQRMRRAFTALPLRWRLVEDVVTSPRTPCSLSANTTAFAQRPLCAPKEFLLRCRRPYLAARVTLWRPLCALLGRQPNAEWRWLIWVCSKCAPSLGVLCDPIVSNGDATALLRWCLRTYCAHISLLHFF